MTETVCYCFGYTESDIVEDLQQHSRSLITENILAAKRAGRCQCATRNPTGR